MTAVARPARPGPPLPSQKASAASYSHQAGRGVTGPTARTPLSPTFWDAPNRESGQTGETRRLPGPLDTLAQLRQKTPTTPVTSTLAPAETLMRRARAKFLTFPIAAGLAGLRSKLEKSYRNTIYCTAELRQENGKVTGVYCGNRWCLVCNRIRTARAIRRYSPIISAWVDPHLVTVTLRNVAGPALDATIDAMVEDFQAVKLGMKRTDGVKLIALRKLECTYNARTDEYHPHFHFVVEGGAAGALLVKRWLERHPDTADEKAQDCRPCDEKALREMFKYFTKLVAKKRRRVGDDDGQPRSTHVPPFALDTIFQAMHRRRVYQPVGFTVAADVPDDEGDITPDSATDALTAERVTWEWNQRASDWVDGSTGECLSGYEPNERFRSFVECIERAPPDS
jgi:hypothetical protein